jgi:hypothetical protein
MPLVVKDRVRETSTTAGTGTFTLAGAVTGFQSFSAIGNGNTTFYTIAGQGTTEWEVGIGTYTSSGTTLSRDTVLESSNAGAKVNFSAGTKDVFVTYPADRTLTGGGGGIGALVVNATTVTENYTIESGTNAQSVGPITVASGVAVTVSSGQRWLVV